MTLSVTAEASQEIIEIREERVAGDEWASLIEEDLEPRVESYEAMMGIDSLNHNEIVVA
ncbi:hypothetical protein [Streptomyces sp. NPDC057909]|uniref:hypothetical protein n=1 Tax=Streptomyces sp. NPDC057909 TaxID=3346277 RepID=UPI0036EC7562